MTHTFDLIEIPPAELEQGILSLADRALALKVTDNVTYGQAAEMLLGYKDLEKNIKTYFAPLKEAAHKAHKAITSRESDELAKLKPIETYLKGEIGVYQAGQERIRREEEARLRAEMEKAEEERMIAEALMSEKEGDKEAAEAILSEPVYIPPPVVPISTPKVAGIATREVWKWEISSESAIPRQYLQVNETAINGVVRSLKGACQIPGIKVYSIKEVAAGRR